MSAKLEILVLGPFPSIPGLVFDRTLLMEGDILTVLAAHPLKPNIWRVLFDRPSDKERTK